METHPRKISPPRESARPLVEWPTLAMVVLCYAGIGALLIRPEIFGLLLSGLLLAILIALHSSLQHEVLHGHPFRSQALSEVLVFPAVGLFIPYLRFRDLHLQHHYDPNLTDPYDDPESNYLDPAVWQRTPAPLRALYRFNNVLLGRMLVGPAISILAMYREDIRLMQRGDGRVGRAYLLHLLGMAPVIWCVAASALPVWVYLIAAYGGLSLLKIRTFLEHRAHEKVPGRTVVIESRGPLSYLFLNNNLHAVHHAHPGLPWYRLPRFFRERRAQFLDRNQSYYYQSYADVFRQHFLRAKDPVPHPLRAAPAAAREMADHPPVQTPRGVASSHSPKSV